MELKNINVKKVDPLVLKTIFQCTAAFMNKFLSIMILEFIKKGFTLEKKGTKLILTDTVKRFLDYKVNVPFSFFLGGGGGGDLDLGCRSTSEYYFL